MAALNSFGRRALLNTILSRSNRHSCRLISTTDKKKESSEGCPPPEAIYKKVLDFSKPHENKNWVSYGFCFKDEMRDNYLMHVSFFCIITVLFCGLGFLYAFFPDKNRKHWARREAFIRLHEREQLGLEPIDRNYVDPSKIILPPDEELGEDEIII